MIVREPWWVYSGLLDRAMCDRIIAHGLSLEMEEGTVRTGNNGSQRKTTISWIDDAWVYDAVHPWIRKANASAGWNFHVERTLMLQFGVYGEGGHYDWHFDDRSGRVYSASDNVSPDFYGQVRKISFSVMLNGGDEYEGGDLEIELGVPSDVERVERPEPERKRGTMVLFPSFLPHRVTPVTKGTRYSLVGWTCGPPWR